VPKLRIERAGAFSLKPWPAGPSEIPIKHLPDAILTVVAKRTIDRIDIDELMFANWTSEHADPSRANERTESELPI
jgi:hypothetical protein